VAAPIQIIGLRLDVYGTRIEVSVRSIRVLRQNGTAQQQQKY
jgi:hypothetical protein